jgi:hypothetical protein
LKFSRETYCLISNSKVELNGKEIEIVSENNSWLNSIYYSLGIDYPKFFKMDNLSKAGFLASELIFREINFDRTIFHKDITIIGFNSSSSLDDDLIYQKTISDSDNFFPSPAVFVYTLANIVLGEIAIRNKIQGETSFYVIEKYDENLIQTYLNDVFTNNYVKGILCGWIDFLNGNCNVKLKYIEKTDEWRAK